MSTVASSGSSARTATNSSEMSLLPGGHKGQNMVRGRRKDRILAAAARAGVIGAGIGGRAAAAGRRAAGWDVTVGERAPALEPVGAGLALAPNGLRALD